MATLTIVPPTLAPTPRATPGALVDAATRVDLSDAPRNAVVVELSEQVRELSDTRKEDGDQAKQDLRSREQLSDEQKREVEQLRQTDREVRSHEAAHRSAGGAHIRGAAEFETVVGPDGRRYATGGEVAIDVSPVEGDPEATLNKMEQVARAALAPTDPSAQDRAVAAQARTTAGEARREILQESAPVGDGQRPDALSTHGHPSTESCPLCDAEGGPGLRTHGLLDRLA